MVNGIFNVYDNTIFNGNMDLNGALRGLGNATIHNVTTVGSSSIGGGNLSIEYFYVNLKSGSLVFSRYAKKIISLFTKLCTAFRYSLWCNFGLSLMESM